MRIELMTLSALKLDRWIAVVMPLPESADLRLLATARRAARCCEREAQAALAGPPSDEADEMRYLGEQSSARVKEIDARMVLASRRRRAAARLGVG